ncbi:MAG: hypothetical protein IT270_14550, partial [Saprospiraceae bacterium]|nr:hypothetical protein [Saprospiraceae bacterium]
MFFDVVLEVVDACFYRLDDVADEPDRIGHDGFDYGFALVDDFHQFSRVVAHFFKRPFEKLNHGVEQQPGQ